MRRAPGSRWQARAARGLAWLFRAEAALACVGLALVIVALLADLLARELAGSGLFGAQRFAVYANSIGSLLGFAIVVQTGGHLRLSIMDRLLPAAWEITFQRVADSLSTLICALLAWFAFTFVKSTYAMGDTDTVFQMRIWPVQVVLPYIFASAGVRYACYALFPALRPAPEAAEENA